MVSAFDNNVLCLLLHPDADVPDDPETGKPVVRAKDRIAHLVEQLRESGSRILIPTPVLMEFMTYAAPEYLNEINASAHFEVAPFDQRAAIEAGRAIQKAKDSDTPLLEGLNATDDPDSSSTEPQQPSEQSPDDEKV